MLDLGDQMVVGPFQSFHVYWWLSKVRKMNSKPCQLASRFRLFLITIPFPAFGNSISSQLFLEQENISRVG